MHFVSLMSLSLRLGPTTQSEISFRRSNQKIVKQRQARQCSSWASWEALSLTTAMNMEWIIMLIMFLKEAHLIVKEREVHFLQEESKMAIMLSISQSELKRTSNSKSPWHGKVTTPASPSSRVWVALVAWDLTTKGLRSHCRVGMISVRKIRSSWGSGERTSVIDCRIRLPIPTQWMKERSWSMKAERKTEWSTWQG